MATGALRREGRNGQSSDQAGCLSGERDEAGTVRGTEGEVQLWNFVTLCFGNGDT